MKTVASRFTSLGILSVLGCGATVPDRMGAPSPTDATATDATGDTEPDETEASPTYDDVWQMRVDNFAIRPVDTDYVCFDFTAQFDEPAHIIGFRPVIDNIAYVHHFVVTLLPEPTGELPGYPCYDLDGDMVWAWSPGADEYWLPKAAGVLVGGAGGSAATIRIQIHYNNLSRKMGEVDSSGLDVYVSKTLREHNAGSLVIADVIGISIPPGQTSYQHDTLCGSAQTRAMLSQPIHVFGSGLHAHEIGRTLWADIYRDGALVTEFNRDQDFSFGDQNYKAVDTVIQPGDEVYTHCIYDSSSRLTITRGGPGTDNEMCWNTLMVYPREALRSDYCGS